MADFFLRNFTGVMDRLKADRIGASEMVSATNASFRGGTIKALGYIRRENAEGTKTLVPTTWESNGAWTSMDLNKVFFVEVNGILYWCSKNQDNGAYPKKRNSDGVEYDVGIEPPAAAPSAITDAGAGNVTGTGLQWAYSYYSSFDDAESPMSPVSSTLSPTSRYVTMGVTASTNPAVDEIWLYRLNNGVYQFADTYANATATISDDVDVLDLGASNQSTDYSLPPTCTTGNSYGICGTYNGMCFMWNGRRVRWSEVNRPNAWPETNFRDYDHEVKVCAPFGRQGVLVATTKSLHILSGPAPESLGNADVDNTLGCAFPKSLTTSEYGILFMSQYGLVQFSGGGAMKLEHAKRSDATIAALVNSTDTYSAAVVNSQYLLFGRDNVLVGDLSRFPSVEWTTSDFSPQAPNPSEYYDVAQGVGRALFSRWTG